MDGGKEAIRDARQRLRQRQAAWKALCRRRDEIASYASKATENWARGLLRGSPHPMLRWDTAAMWDDGLVRCNQLVSQKERELEAAAADLRAVIRDASVPYKSVFLALNERGPVLYQHGVDTGNWAPYEEFRRTEVNPVRAAIADLGLTTRMIMLS